MPHAITRAQETCRASFALQPDPTLPPNTFRGLASVFGTLIDTWIPTRILPGAFTKTLQEQAARVKVLWQHDSDEPIGKPTRMEETAAGLLVEGAISDVQRGREALTLMRDGVIDELSIGFDPIKWQTVQEGQEVKTEVRLLQEVRLWEFSLVTFGANSDAKILSVHTLARAGWPTELAAAFEPLLAQARQADSLAAALAPFISRFVEAHEGKVLSAKNKQLVSDALAALQALIDAAEPPPDGQALTVRVEQLQRDLVLMALTAGVAV